MAHDQVTRPAQSPRPGTAEAAPRTHAATHPTAGRPAVGSPISNHPSHALTCGGECPSWRPPISRGHTRYSGVGLDIMPRSSRIHPIPVGAGPARTYSHTEFGRRAPMHDD